MSSAFLSIFKSPRLTSSVNPLSLRNTNQPLRSLPLKYQDTAALRVVINNVEREVLPEDISYLRRLSMRIISDTITVLSQEEIESCVFPEWKSGKLQITNDEMTRQLLHSRLFTIPASPLAHSETTGVLSWILHSRYKRMIPLRYQQLIRSTLRNGVLFDTFRLGYGYNSQVIFQYLTLWLLSHSFSCLTASERRKLKRFYMVQNNMLGEWLPQKNVPGFHRMAEMKNMNQQMNKLLQELDGALSHPEIAPALLAMVIHRNLFEGQGRLESPAVIRMTRWLLRQKYLLSRIPEQALINFAFSWAPFPRTDDSEPEMVPQRIDHYINKLSYRFRAPLWAWCAHFWKSLTFKN